MKKITKKEFSALFDNSRACSLIVFRCLTVWAFRFGCKTLLYVGPNIGATQRNSI